VRERVRARGREAVAAAAVDEVRVVCGEMMKKRKGEKGVNKKEV
jgi:hypothetical protein